MGARQREWARKTRDFLFDDLGRACKWCGATEATAKLTFDVVIPTAPGAAHGNGHHRKMDWSMRMTFYKRAHERGNLQVLCDKCNTKKGDSVTVHESEFPHVHAIPQTPF